MLSSLLSRPILIGLASLSLMLSLTGCSTTRYITVVERELPPSYLLEDCQEPASIRPAVNADLIRHLHDWRNAFRQCNADKAALRAWAESE